MRPFTAIKNALRKRKNRREHLKYLKHLLDEEAAFNAVVRKAIEDLDAVEPADDEIEPEAKSA